MNGYNYLEPVNLTPAEIAARLSNNQRLMNDAAIENQNVNMGLNIAQLGNSGSLGFLLGSLGGQMYQNYRQRGDRKKIDAANTRLLSKSLGEYGQSLIPEYWQNQSQNEYWKTPADGNYFTYRGQTPEYNFQVPQNVWQNRKSVTSEETNSPQYNFNSWQNQNLNSAYNSATQNNSNPQYFQPPPGLFTNDFKINTLQRPNSWRW